MSSEPLARQRHPASGNDIKSALVRQALDELSPGDLTAVGVVTERLLD